MSAAIFLSRFARPGLLAFLPLLVLAGIFGLIAALNWGYADIFFKPAMIHDRTDDTIGLRLLATGFGFGVASSAFAFLAVRHAVRGGKWKWPLCGAALIVSLVCLLVGFVYIACGPAIITAKEQLTNSRSTRLSQP